MVMIVFSSSASTALQSGAAVVREHRRDHQNEPDQAGGDTAADGIGAERRPDRALFDHLYTGGQRSGAQVERKIGRFLLSGGSRDAALIGNPVLDGRRAEHDVVEHNREPVTDVGFGVALKAAGRFLGQHEAGFPTAGHVTLLRTRSSGTDRGP